MPGQIDVAEQMNLFKRRQCIRLQVFRCMKGLAMRVSKMRPASAFGVEFVTNRDADTWQDWHHLLQLAHFFQSIVSARFVCLAWILAIAFGALCDVIHHDR
eukprot:311995-Amphidinium_carterae.1